MTSFMCPKCHCKADSKGEPFRHILEDILEGYYLTNEPVLIRINMRADYVLAYMERIGFIKTTEIPDPEFPDRDIILALPVGHFTNNEDDCFFCFGSEKHA